MNHITHYTKIYARNIGFFVLVALLFILSGLSFTSDSKFGIEPRNAMAQGNYYISITCGGNATRTFRPGNTTGSGGTIEIEEGDVCVVKDLCVGSGAVNTKTFSPQQPYGFYKDRTCMPSQRVCYMQESGRDQILREVCYNQTTGPTYRIDTLPNLWFDNSKIVSGDTVAVSWDFPGISKKNGGIFGTGIFGSKTKTYCTLSSKKAGGSWVTLAQGTKGEYQAGPLTDDTQFQVACKIVKKKGWPSKKKSTKYNNNNIKKVKIITPPAAETRVWARNLTNPQGDIYGSVVISPGDEIELEWESDYATECDLVNSSGDPSFDALSVAISGIDPSINEPNPNESNLFEVQCRGSGGQGPSASILVSTSAAYPDLDALSVSASGPFYANEPIEFTVGVANVGYADSSAFYTAIEFDNVNNGGLGNVDEIVEQANIGVGIAQTGSDQRIITWTPSSGGQYNYRGYVDSQNNVDPEVSDLNNRTVWYGTITVLPERQAEASLSVCNFTADASGSGCESASDWTSSDIIIAEGDQVWLEWSSKWADSCTFSEFGGSGTGSTSGTDQDVVEPELGNKIRYAVQCEGLGQTSPVVGIQVDNQAFEVAIDVSDRRVRIGEEVTLTWDTNSNDPVACEIEGPGNFTSPTPMTQTNEDMPPITIQILAESTFKLSCGPISEEITVEIIPSFFDS